MGSPVTLHTLALKMISISDNTATDHLAVLAGPRADRAADGRDGAQPSRGNLPLLSTAEMTHAPRQEDRPARTRPTRSSTKPRSASSWPTTSATCQTMKSSISTRPPTTWPNGMPRRWTWLGHWHGLNDHTLEGMPAHPLRAILAIDPKLPPDAEGLAVRRLQGRVRGSASGRQLALQNHNSHWYTFHVYCNSPDKSVHPEQMISAIQKILSAVERDLPQQ